MNKKEEFLRDIESYIMEEPGHNIVQTADHFNVTRDTIRAYLKLLSTPDSLYYDEARAKRINIVLNRLLSEARSKAGASGRRKTVLSLEDALELRRQNEFFGVNLRALAKEKGCSHTSVANAIKSIPLELVLKQNAEMKDYFARQKEELQKAQEAFAKGEIYPSEIDHTPAGEDLD